MIISITLLLSYIVVTQHILEPQTYRTEDTKIGLQYSIGRLTLSSTEASLCYGEAFASWGGWGERKRERAGHDRPPRAFYFFF